MEEKNRIMEQLRATLLKDIELQEHVRTLFAKILRRVTTISITIACIVLAMIGFLIYVITKPVGATETALRNIKEINYSLTLQRKFIEIDRKDVAAARQQLTSLMRMQDSIQRRQDSMIDREYKKSIKNEP